MFGHWLIEIINYRSMAINQWLWPSMYFQHMEEVRFFLQLEYHKVTMFNEARQSVITFPCGNINGPIKYWLFYFPTLWVSRYFTYSKGTFQLYSSRGKICTNENMDTLRKIYECKYFVIPMREKKRQEMRLLSSVKLSQRMMKRLFDFLRNESREVI